VIVYDDTYIWLLLPGLGDLGCIVSRVTSPWCHRWSSRPRRGCPSDRLLRHVRTARKIGLDGIIGPEGSSCRDLVLAMIVARISDPG
jgi:hypothetical protein